MSFGTRRNSFMKKSDVKNLVTLSLSRNHMINTLYNFNVVGIVFSVMYPVVTISTLYLKVQ